ncbi:MAG: hypothetical protein R2854_32405 [Caldilineaceae bacterium]
MAYGAVDESLDGVELAVAGVHRIAQRTNRCWPGSPDLPADTSYRPPTLPVAGSMPIMRNTSEALEAAWSGLPAGSDEQYRILAVGVQRHALEAAVAIALGEIGGKGLPPSAHRLARQRSRSLRDEAVDHAPPLEKW